MSTTFNSLLSSMGKKFDATISTGSTIINSILSQPSSETTVESSKRPQKNKHERGAAVKYKYNHIFEHKFQAIWLTQPTYCSQCNEFILGFLGQACILCGLVSHRDCLYRIDSNCLESPNISNEQRIARDDSSNQHKLNQKIFILPTSCNHCGTFITNLGSLGLECDRDNGGCGLAVHSKCKKYITNRSCIWRERKQHQNNLLSSSSSSSNSQTLEWNKVSFEDFQALKLLGRGSISKVFLVELKSTNHKNRCEEVNLCKRTISSFSYREDKKKQFAMKIIEKTNIVVASDPESVKTEMKVLNLGRSFSFLPIVHCCFQSKERLFFIMEFANGKDLFYHIFGKNQKFSESRAKFYAAEIFLALDYLHSNGIIHRDLKLENIILENNGHCKLIDFGMSKRLSSEQLKTKTFCGTPRYISPEIIKENLYDYSVDWWAFGVLLYEMLLCDSPFINEDSLEEDEIYKRILLYDPMKYFPKDFISSEARDLLERLLAKNPQDRIGCQLVEGCSKAIKDHQFFYFKSNTNNISLNNETSSFHCYNNNPKDSSSSSQPQQQWEAILTKQFKVPYLPTNNDLSKDNDNNHNDNDFYDDVANDDNTSSSANLTLPSIDSKEVNKIPQEEFKGFSYFSESFDELLDLSKDDNKTYPII